MEDYIIEYKMEILVLIIIVAIVFFYLFGKWLDGDLDKKSRLNKELKILAYLNSDIAETCSVIGRINQEIELGLIKHRWQLKQRFAELMITYGYVPKLDLKITKQIKEN